MCGLLGISLPLQVSSSESNTLHTSVADTILIIGSGAAGMSAGYMLNQKGVHYKILEASDNYGGRMKRTTKFVDFPISLGAEWLHTEKQELANIVNDPSTTLTTQLKGYSGQEDIGYYENGHLYYYPLSEAFGNNFHDKKFINYTWFDFFSDYVYPKIRGNIQLNTQVTSIKYQDDYVIATDTKGLTYKANKVIISVPLKILQNNTITFSPELPQKKLTAIQNAPVWGGIKVFIEFTKKFYPTYLTFSDSETNTGQRAYFDAAYAQNTSSNVLGLFAVGKQAKSYQGLSKNNQIAYILNELDQIFDGKASRSYKKHIVQDWDKDPFIQSAYLADVAPSSISHELSTPVGNKLYFAGDSYTYEDDWGGVHNATRSAQHAVKEIIQL